MGDIDAAYGSLLTYSDEDALLALSAIEERREKTQYLKYWSCDRDPNHQIFFDTIEECFEKFTEDIKIFGLLGGNRSSKTERGAFIAVAWLFGKEYFRDEPSWRYVQHLPIPDHGVNIWAVGLDFSVIRDVIWNEKLRRGHQHPGLLPQTPCKEITRISDSDFQVQVEVNGRKSTLICKSAEAGPSKFQSASVDLLWIDEECEEDVYNEGYQRTVDCGGKILITLTPLTDIGSAVKRPWVFNLHKEFKTGRNDVIFTQLSALDNPFIPDIEKTKLKAKWAGHPEERARLYGDFIQRAGMVYPMFSVDKHVCKRQTLPAEWRRIITIDPAATGVTAALWLAISPRNDVYVYRTYYERDAIVSDHAKEILARNGQDKIDTWIIDPFWGAARNAETHKQGYQLYREAGCPVRMAPRAEDYGRNIMAEYLNATLDSSSRQAKLYIMEGNPQLIDEIQGYVWDFVSKGPMKGLSKDKPMKRNDHAINALQYALSLKPKSRRGSGIGTTGPANSYS